MTTVLLTRPLAASQSLAGELKRQGYDVIVEPLLTIEGIPTPRPDITGFGAVMITSGNALEAGQGIKAFIGLPCFCVGARTAERARAGGFQNVRHAEADGNELARLIDDAFPRATRVLHISGRDIASKARDELTRRGHSVVEWPVYAAEPVAALTAAVTGALRRQEIDVILVFSARTAGVLAVRLEQNALEACCKDLTAIGLSEAVTDALRPLPWKRLAAASAPTEEAVIDCLKQIHPVSRKACP